MDEPHQRLDSATESRYVTGSAAICCDYTAIFASGFQRLARSRDTGARTREEEEVLAATDGGRRSTHGLGAELGDGAPHGARGWSGDGERRREEDGEQRPAARGEAGGASEGRGWRRWEVLVLFCFTCWFSRVSERVTGSG